MKKILSITFLLFLISLNMHSQCQDITYGYKNYPPPCVENAIKWLNMSRASWTLEMQKYNFKKIDFDEKGAPYYGTSDEHFDIGIGYYITKDFDILKLENNVIGNVKKDIFKDIITQIEPHFLKKVGNWNYFVFKYKDNETYQFGVNQSSTLDFIYISKM